jgi:hypothetical protein
MYAKIYERLQECENTIHVALIYIPGMLRVNIRGATLVAHSHAEDSLSLRLQSQAAGLITVFRQQDCELSPLSKAVWWRAIRD